MRANRRQWLAGNYALTDPRVKGAHDAGARSADGDDLFNGTGRRD